MAKKDASHARKSKGAMSRRTLKAIVAAIPPHRYIFLQLYCAVLFHFIWMAASRAGLDTTGLWRRATRFIGRSGGKRFRLSKNIRARRMCRAVRATAWRAIMPNVSARLSKKNGLFGDGEGEGAAQGARSIGRTRPHYRESSCILKMGRTIPLLSQRAPRLGRQTDMEITVACASYRRF